MRDHLAGAPAPRTYFGRRLIRWICNNNPFYVVSAVLILLGLRISSNPSATVFPLWALLGGLAGYTLLLAVMACVLVRLGSVWEDVRTLLLLIVLAFVTVSIFFDDLLMKSPRAGIACEFGGLAFAVLVSEGVLRGMRLRLPWGYRSPYYLILALFFLYPVGLTPLLAHPESPGLPWALFGFGTTGAMLFLTLIPAIRRGPEYVQKNGSPWRWPLYPWVVFGFLALAVGARSYYLCLSVHYSSSSGSYVNLFSSIFGGYFLVPLLLSLAILLLEMGLERRNDKAIRLAMLAPIGIVVLASVGHRFDPEYRRFLGMFTAATGGTPLFVTLIAVFAFYAMALLRRVSGSMLGVSLALLGFVMIGPRSLDFTMLEPPNPVPLVVLGVLHGIVAVRQSQSWRALFALACLVISSAIVPGDDTVETFGWRLMVVSQTSLIALVVLGLWFDDGLGRFARVAGAIWMAMLGLLALRMSESELFGFPLRAYPMLLTSIGSLYALWTGFRIYGIAALVNFLGCSLAWGWEGYCRLRVIVLGLDQIAFGMLFFALAAGISLAKAGVLESLIHSKTQQIDAHLPP